MCPHYFLDVPGTIVSGEDAQAIAALRDILLPRLASGEVRVETRSTENYPVKRWLP